jgi:hypothetical protein
VGIVRKDQAGFSEWLREQRYREGHVGDLSRYASERGLIVDDVGAAEMRARLLWQHAASDLQAALRYAESEWREQPGSTRDARSTDPFC